MPRKRRFWIQSAVRRRGALHRQLGIPSGENIPTTLLRAIVRTPVGGTVQNPTNRGRRRYTVTTMLKRRAVLALTLRRMRRKKR